MSDKLYDYDESADVEAERSRARSEKNDEYNLDNLQTAKRFIRASDDMVIDLKELMDRYPLLRQWLIQKIVELES